MSHRARPLPLATAAGILLVVGCTARAPTGSDAGKPLVVVTTSVLESAVREVGGDRVAVFRMLPPSSCPGHFDLKPQDFERIARSRLVFRHDYQAHLEKKLKEAGTEAKRIVVIRVDGPETIPEHFAAACRTVGAALSELLPASAGEFERNVAEAERRMAALDEQMRVKLAAIKGRRVLVSQHQTEFCRWCGLDVVGSFDTAGDTSLKELGELVTAAKQRGVVGVVANRQRGTREADALAEKLSVPVVVLSNFPDANAGQKTMADMIRSNCDMLVSGIPHG